MNEKSKVKIVYNLFQASEHLSLALMELNKNGRQEDHITKQINDLDIKVRQQLSVAFSDPVINRLE